ncbi:MAG: arginine deiminase-related protein [Bacteroidota bacterium]
MKQCTSHLMMVRPANFGANPLTAASNAFQQELESSQADEVKNKAIQEFDAFVSLLRSKGVHVTVFDDTAEPLTPDAVFPNNWISFHQNGKIVLYPMFAPNRRWERRMDVPHHFAREASDIWNWAEAMEPQSLILEGTGSLILDRVNKIAYACTSNRTSPKAFDLWAKEMGYKGLLFQAVDEKGQEIYHTNVMMFLGKDVAVICLESIANPALRQAVQDKLKSTGHKIIGITFDQMNAFAGNMLQVDNVSDESMIIMSQRAHQSLTPLQLDNLAQHAEILTIPLDVIETYGGGSVRCMMAEVFLPE